MKILRYERKGGEHVAMLSYGKHQPDGVPASQAVLESRIQFLKTATPWKNRSLEEQALAEVRRLNALPGTQETLTENAV